MREIPQVNVGGIVVGINMLDQILSEVKAMDLQGKKEIRDEMLKRRKIYNYIPVRAEEQ